ncbi:MAG: patatin-like phospholipase family protein [Flavobacteriaceae bacterium]
MKANHLVICIISIFNIGFLSAQTTELYSKDELKVGLVLSGGGAKGLSHIGVIKELEKNGVRIDYIGGTSMGAIIGALYSVGYSPDEMVEIIKTTDFDAVLSDDVDRRYKSLFDKENGEKYALTLPIVNKKLGLPLSVSRGQGVLNLLTKLFEPVDSISDFSQLPIPFYCIATNVADGSMEVLDSGSLPLAVRASGSFPTFFQPVEIDDELYIDGGLVSNFPVKEMRKRGVDVIIGVDVQSQLLPVSQVNSVLDLLDQIISFGMYEKSAEEKPYADIYIHPDIEGLSTFTFGDPTRIVSLGSTEAAKNSVALKKLAEIQGSHTPIERSGVVLENKTFVISDIVIEGNKEYTKKYLLKKIGIQIGDEISYEEFNNRMQSVTYQGTIERMSYRIDKNENSEWVLKIDIKESKVHSFLKLAVHYDPLYQTGVLLNGTSYHFLQKNDVISADVVVGDNLRYNVNYFSDNGGIFGYGLNARYNTFSDNVAVDIEGFNKINIDYTDFTENIYAEAVFASKFAFGLGVEHKYINANTETLETENDEPYYMDKSHYFNTFGYLKADTFDRSYYPKHGMYLNASYDVYIASSDFNNDFKPFSQLKFDYRVVGSFLKDKLTLDFSAGGGVTLRNSLFAFDYFGGGYGENYINNFIPLYGYDFAAVYGDSYAKLGLDVRYEVLKKSHLLIGANAGRFSDSLFQGQTPFEDIDFGFAAGVGLQSIIGPIDLKYGFSPVTGRSQWYFDLGFWF